MIGGILAGRSLDDAHASSDALKRAGNCRRVYPAGLVLVGDDDDVRAAKDLAVLPPPLAGAARVAGRHAAGLDDGEHVLLSLGDVHGRSGGDPGKQLGKAEQWPRHAMRLPDPAPMPVGPALAERLRNVAHHLEDQDAVGVAVVVGRRHDRRPGADSGGPHRQAHLIQSSLHRRPVAAGQAVEGELAIIVFPEMQTGLVIIMQRTAHEVAVATAARLREPGPDERCLEVHRCLLHVARLDAQHGAKFRRRHQDAMRDAQHRQRSVARRGVRSRPGDAHRRRGVVDAAGRVGEQSPEQLASVTRSRQVTLCVAFHELDDLPVQDYAAWCLIVVVSMLLQLMMSAMYMIPYNYIT